jgi:NTE family protein
LPRGGRLTTAFVMAGGASLGALQVGMLRALYERDILPDLFVGTSVGALNAAFVTSRPQEVVTADELARIWTGVERQDVFPLDVYMLVGGLSGWRDHVVGPHALKRIVRRHIGFDDLAESPIPIHVVAFDLISGREVLLSSGPAVDAVLAATAIPGILPPVRMGGRRLVDAGVANNTPISHAVALGAQRIYVLPTQDPANPLGTLPRTALDAAVFAFNMRTNDRLQADLVRYQHDAEIIVLPAPNHHRIQPTDFGHARTLTDEALVAARAALDRSPASVRSGTGSAHHLYAVSPPATS